MKNIRICTDEDLKLTKSAKAYLSGIGSKGGKIGGKSKTAKKQNASRANLLKARLARKKKLT